MLHLSLFCFLVISDVSRYGQTSLPVPVIRERGCDQSAPTVSVCRTLEIRGSPPSNLHPLCSLVPDWTKVGCPNACEDLYGKAQSIPPEIIAAAALGVTDGATLRFTSVEELLNDDHIITCVIEIENWTKYLLANPIVHIHSGAVTGNPVAILPGTREVMVARKTSAAPIGSSGTVSWEINLKSRRFVVMWEVPFIETFYNNLLGVGLTAVNYTNHAGGDTWYNEMTDGAISTTLQYAEKEFSNNNPNPIQFHHDNFLIEGTMTSTQESHVRILFTPSDPAELAPSIAEYLAA